MFQRISNAFVAWRLYRRPLQDRIDLANDPAISDELVMLLAGDPEPAVRLQVAHRHPAADNLLERLAQDQDSDVRLEVAGRIFLPDVIMAILAYDPLPEVRRAIANCPMPQAVWEVLARDPDSTVRQNLLGCRTLTTEARITILRELVSGGTPPIPPILCWLIERWPADTELHLLCLEVEHDTAEVIARRATSPVVGIRLAGMRHTMVGIELLGNAELNDNPDVLNQLRATWFGELERLSAVGRQRWQTQQTFWTLFEGLLQAPGLTRKELETLPAEIVRRCVPDRLSEGRPWLTDVIWTLSDNNPMPLADVWQAAQLLVGV